MVLQTSFIIHFLAMTLDRIVSIMSYTSSSSIENLLKLSNVTWLLFDS